MRKFALATIALFALACSAKKTVTTAAAITQADADRGNSKFSGVTMASLNEGKMNYEANCGNCHGLKPLDSKDENGWRDIVPPMAEKAQIDEHTQDMILQYVVTMCGK